MTAYYALVTSLPRHDLRFKVKETPISHRQLEKRLTLLTDEDRRIAEGVVELVWKQRFSGNVSLVSTLCKAKEFLQSDNAFIRNLVQWTLDIQSLLTALRWRKIHKTPPPRPADVWHTRFNALILSRWQEPDLGMQYALPWFSVLAEKQVAGNTAEAENIFLQAFWKYLLLSESRHYFDLEAIIIYLLRWHIVDYWSKFSESGALSRINDLALACVKNSPVDINLYKASFP